jgi:hypothetical protein
MRRLTSTLVAAGLLGAGGCAVGPAPAADSPEPAAGARPSRPAASFGHLGGDPRAAVEVLGGQVRPGVPSVERQVHDGVLLTLTVAPARPGWNLVRVDTAGPDQHAHEHGEAVAVGTDPAHLVPATPRPGTDGSWARVRLPAGASTVYVGHGPHHRVPFPVDTGTASGPRAPTVPGADGPECTAASTGRLLAGDRTPLDHCPAETLGPADAADLRAMVGTLADRRVPTVALLADGSARGRAARSLVLKTATARGLRVVAADRTRDGALVVVGGWSRAATGLARAAREQRHGIAYQDGVWLAPWLLTPRVVDAISGTVLPLRFDVRGTSARAYAAALRRTLPSVAPTEAGFAGWRAGQRTPYDGPASLYAAARAAFMAPAPGHQQHETTVAWFPGGTVTRVSGPLEERAG